MHNLTHRQIKVTGGVLIKEKYWFPILISGKKKDSMHGVNESLHTTALHEKKVLVMLNTLYTHIFVTDTGKPDKVSQNENNLS